MDLLTRDGIDRPWTANDRSALDSRSKPGGSILRRLRFFLKRLKVMQDQYDLVILHGIWSAPVLAMHLGWNGRSNYAVFPHGMLDPYFIKFFPIKHIKKSIAYRLVVEPVLKKAAAVLFTCDEELRLAATSYMPASGRRIVVRYGIDDNSRTAVNASERIRTTLASLAGKETFLFISRIHPKKGCDDLIEALADVGRSNPDVHLLIAGPDDVGWTPKLKELSQRLQVEDRVTWLGPVFGPDKWFLYKNSKVLILPSHMENFGMVVAEALASGQPVLISDKVNIHSYITEARAGFVDVDTVQGTINLMTNWIASTGLERLRMSEAALALFQRRFQSVSTAQDVLSLALSLKNVDVPVTTAVG
jgi:glycosyltransferase involved in cell wall biosynthesis